MVDLAEKIQWHLGFCGAVELELNANKEDLEFHREYDLGEEPFRVDMLLVKKRDGIEMENEIGHIFGRYNILEYKCPDDGMTIDDYFRTLGYAFLYKGLSEIVDAVPFSELTVSLIGESYPKEMINALKSLGATVEEEFPGIYYVSGIAILKSQIVVTGQLVGQTHSSLQILSKNAKMKDVRNFLRNSASFETPGDKNNADEVLQVSVSANRLLYEQVKEDSIMCEALEKLMKPEPDRKQEDGVQYSK